MKTDLIPLQDEAVGLYLHIPFCTRKCRYCSFYSEPVADHDARRLISSMIAELDRYRAVETINTIYIGGGSPTALPLNLLDRLLETIVSIWPKPREFTVECNPKQIDTSVLSVLSKHGVNRLSFGVQSFNTEELALLGRGHSPDQAIRAIGQAYDFSFGNIGLDLIFAIPDSTLASWKHSLESAIALGVEHISAYGLSIEPGTALYQAKKAGQLAVVDEETDRAMYEMAIDELGKADFAQYEISNFAREGFRCLHNQGYWANRPYIGIGPAAGSYWNGRRMSNVADIGQYIQRIEAGLAGYECSEQPSPTDRICETAVLNLRTRDGIDLSHFRVMTGVDFVEMFSTSLRRYERQGLMEVTSDRVRLSRRALAVADPILCDFSAF